MLLLHGAIFRNRFLLWAEDSEAPGLDDLSNQTWRQSSTQPVEIAAQSEIGEGINYPWLLLDTTEPGESFVSSSAPPRQPELLPFAASTEKVKEALAAATGLPCLNSEQMGLGIICIPTSDGLPLASTPMIGRSIEDADISTVRLSPWEIPVLFIEMEQLVDLLCYCFDTEKLADGLVVGEDLRFWAIAMRFAGSLVAKQQFLPGLKASNDGSFACWDPIFVGDDGERFAYLAAGMPLACLAPEADPFETDANQPTEVLTRFLTKITDYLVRSSRKENLTLATNTLLKAAPDATRLNMHQRWLEALVGEDNTLAATVEEVAKLSDQIAEWRRPIEVASDIPYRLCLRLEEPFLEHYTETPPLTGDDPEYDYDVDPESDSNSASDELSNFAPETDNDHDGDGQPARQSISRSSCRMPWYVRFLLQSLKDPGVLLPIDTVLSPSHEDLLLLRGGKVSAREYLFRSLGQAVRLCPDIEKSFADAHPQGFELDTNQAYEFLSKTAPILKNAGFSVQLPNWWTRKQKIGAKAKVFSSGNQLFSLKNMAALDWQLVLGGQPISVKELEKLAELKVPLIRWQGMWVELNPEQLTPILQFFSEHASRQNATGYDIVNLALGAQSLPEGVQFDGISGDGKLVEVIRQLQGQSGFTELSVHQHFRGQLRPYQIRGMSWLAFLKTLGFGACLADDMGLGKTVQTLAYIQKHWYEQEAGQRHPTLLVCPTSVIGNWQREMGKFTPDLDVLVHHGQDRLEGSRFVRAARRSAIVLTSYALLHRDYDDLKALNWDLIILDEAQNIKNPETQQTIAACSLNSRFRIALTGTPVENSVGDLWSLMNFLNPGLLGSHSSFKEKFFKPIQIFQNEDKMHLLKRLTGPFILRRLKTDKSIVTDLPEKFERKTRCHLSKEQASLYGAIVGEAAKELDNVTGMKRKSLVLTTMMRLKQICDHPALVVKNRSAGSGRSGKLKRLTEMLEQILINDERALIFTQFAQMGQIIQNHVQSVTGKEVLFLHGGTGRNARDRMVERFQNQDGPPVFVLSLKAGGTGLNLTRANHVFHYDRWWNPAVENQATDRAFRIGQEKNVAVHKFVCAGTLEENIDELIERKKAIASSAVSSGEGWLTELSTAELRDIFSLKETLLVD